jgi:hypothetical protein
MVFKNTILILPKQNHITAIWTKQFFSNNITAAN